MRIYENITKQEKEELLNSVERLIHKLVNKRMLMKSFNGIDKKDLIQDVKIYIWQIISKYDSTQSKFITYIYNNINWFLGTQHFKNVNNFNNFNIDYNEFNEDLYANNNDSIESEADKQDLNTILKAVWNDLNKTEQKEVETFLKNEDELMSKKMLMIIKKIKYIASKKDII